MEGSRVCPQYSIFELRIALVFQNSAFIIQHLRYTFLVDHISYRFATVADIESLVTLRAEFIAEVREAGSMTPSFKKVLRDYFSRTLPTREFVAYVAVAHGQIIATSGLVFHRQPPTPWNLHGTTGYIMNMYTQSAWRHQGVATTLLQLLISYASEHQCHRISLHAMPQARHLYTGLGFMPSDDEMVLDLNDLNAGG